MNVLLLSMPDSFEHMPPLTMRMPNGALGSLAANVDRHHRVATADLILARSDVAGALERLVRDVRPDIVGLSVMTFQRATAMKLARAVRRLRPQVRLVAGGYDPSLAPEAYESCPEIEFVVRGEGEAALRELLRALEAGRVPSDVAGLSYRESGVFVHNPPRPAERALDRLRLPDRSTRALEGYTLLGRPVDVVETSRGCTFDCSFCSIIEMRGRNFFVYPIERVLADIADARGRGARAIFLVDDNITLDIRRFERLCHAIVDSGFNDVDYIVQGMTAPLARHGETLAPLMRRAGFRYVFLGIENVLEDDLAFLHARAKNASRENGRAQGLAAATAIDHLHRHGMYVVGGLIVGNPGDTRESIETNLEFARRYVDWPYIQHPTPYPGTPMAADFRARGLIVEHDVTRYDGTTAVVRSEHLSAAEIEFLRWRSERWMKLRHLPPVFLHSPWFVLRHGPRMLAHTFTGTTFRSMLGLESQRAVFERFRARRRAEREVLVNGDRATPARGGTPPSRARPRPVRPSAT
jgi:radical SAM superfamily enzyme YgiQ (UPF0313 family)